MLFQPIGELILRVAQRERVEKGGAPRARFALQGHERLAFPCGKTLVVPDGGELGLEYGAAQPFGGPPGGCGRVVQLVSEARRELAQGCQLLLLAEGALRLARPEMKTSATSGISTATRRKVSESISRTRVGDMARALWIEVFPVSTASPPVNSPAPWSTSDVSSAP